MYKKLLSWGLASILSLYTATAVLAKPEAEQVKPKENIETIVQNLLETDKDYLEIKTKGIQYIKTRRYGTDIYVAVFDPKEFEAKLLVADYNPFNRSYKNRISNMTRWYEKVILRNVLLAFNAGYFCLDSGIPIGRVVINKRLQDYKQRQKRFNKLKKKTYSKKTKPRFSDYTFSFRSGVAIHEDGTMTLGYYPKDHFKGKHNVTYFVTAGPMLVFGGKNVAEESRKKEKFGKKYKKAAPRTALGVTADNKCILLVCDGRSEKNKGLTLEELAELFIASGAKQAIKLDGGGSSALLLSGEFFSKSETFYRMMNTSSDGFERSISNCISLLER